MHMNKSLLDCHSLPITHPFIHHLSLIISVPHMHFSLSFYSNLNFSPSLIIHKQVTTLPFHFHHPRTSSTSTFLPLLNIPLSLTNSAEHTNITTPRQYFLHRPPSSSLDNFSRSHLDSTHPFVQPSGREPDIRHINSCTRLSSVALDPFHSILRLI